MRVNRAICVIFMTALVGYGCTQHGEAPASSDGALSGSGYDVPEPGIKPEGERVLGEYIVRGEASLERETLHALFGQYGIREIRDLGRSRFLIRLTDDPGLSVIRESASDEERIRSVEPNLRYHAPEPPSDASSPRG